MIDVSLTYARTHLRALLDQVAAGQPVCITRRGKPAALLYAVGSPRVQVDVAALRALTDSMPRQIEGAEAGVRRMRDRSRY